MSSLAIGEGKGRPINLRIAVVGCGKAAENHTREIRKIAGASIVAACDLEPLMAEQLAVRYAIPRQFSDFDAMLDAVRPDVVHITTPPESHLPLAAKAIDAGCHVFVEKPLTPCYLDSLALVRHATRGNRKLAISYGYYFDPVARALRDLLADDVLGEVVHVESVLGYSLSGQFGSCVLADRDHWVHRLPGKLAHNVIDHLLNKIAEFVSDEATVHARAWQRETNGHPAHPDCSLPDELRLMVFDGNRSAYGTFTSHARPIAHLLNVYGTKRTARLDFELGTISVSGTAVLPGALGRLSRTFGEGVQCLRQSRRNVIRFVRGEYHALAGLHYLINAFYDSVKQESPVPVSYPDILKVAALTDAVFDQLAPQRALIGP
jgi:predicted dehydrogenase